MDIADWLARLGLDEYIEAFQENAIDERVLASLTASDLSDLGIAKIGHRRRVLEAIEALRYPPTGNTKPTNMTVLSGEAERRHLTILFCDMVGSTELSARLDPEDINDVIRAYQDASAGAVARYGGFVAKFMGDGVIAYFGYPSAHEDDAERAVRAGLEMIRVSTKLLATDGTPINVRIGIATGVVVVGELVGHGVSQELAVAGETPNLAARLQALSEPGGLLISNETRNLLADAFDFEAFGPVELKGIPGKVEAFIVLGESSAQSRFAARSPEFLPMVGRDNELNLLVERWERAERGEGQCVLLVGEAGIGKSRIVRGFQSAIEDPTTVYFQCSPYHSDSTLWPVINQIAQAARLAPADTKDEKLDKLESYWRAGTSACADVALIADLLGIDFDGRFSPIDLSPSAQRAKTLEAVWRHLLLLSETNPLLVVLEDGHWADPTTRELIEHLLEATSATRILILMTSRMDNQPSMAAHPDVTRITLNRLGRDWAENMVRRIGEDRLPDRTVEAIIQRTDGVPLFVEELTKAVLETGEATIPASLHDSLMARLDRIPEVKETAQIASCIGREFDLATLTAIVDGPDSSIRAALDRLISAELVYRRGAPTDCRYIFKHALVRDAAYESLLKRKRREVHLKLAEFSISQAKRGGNVLPELIATHLVAGAEPGRSVRWWLDGAIEALRKGADKEASLFCQQGLLHVEAIEDPLEGRTARIDLLLSLYGADYGQGDVDHLLNVVEQATTLAREAGDGSRLSRALDSRAYVLASAGRIDDAISCGREAVELSDSLEDEHAFVGANTMLARALYAQGTYAEAIHYITRVKERLGFDVGRGDLKGAMNQTQNCRTWRALMCAEVGEFASGEHDLMEAVSILPEIRAPDHEELWIGLAFARLKALQGAYTEVVAKCDPLLDRCRHELPVYLPRMAMSFGPALVQVGEKDRGLSLLEEADSLGEDKGFLFLRALMLSEYSAVQRSLGEVDSAAKTAARATATATRTGERGSLAWSLLRSCEAEIDRGNDHSAAMLLAQSESIARKRGMKPLLDAISALKLQT
ncbi:AAA family ATPase [Ruegeria lacuscaerulensis]|uniref:AAA family ATPase n=1 Tax=Ruegeria lacuscaerulensis TaxID=55218 RepID=UPI0014816C97|nr:adenylate/guanylate cyclase domain-containing protein [Ruegeria lacuscaerulensis]